MQDDATLLRRYAAERADDAFADLVRRHLDLVYSAALRQVGGDAHLAQDVAQTVFADLARKAGQLARHPVLAGWLYSSTNYAAAKAVRTEQRRRRREHEAGAMNELLHDSAGDEVWAQVRPTLDAAMQGLRAADRDAILLRFFEGRSFAAIGAQLRLSENAARMRVERALEKLRAQLARRGVGSTAAALGAVLATHGVAAAPAGGAAAITTATLAGLAMGGGGTTVLTLMTANKLPLALAATVLIGGGGALVVQQRDQDALREEIAALHTESGEAARLRVANATLAREAAQVEALQRTAEGLPTLRTEAAALRANAARAASPSSPRAADPSSPTVSASGEPTYAYGQLDQPPRPTFRKAPTYPLELRGIPGSVKLNIVVGADGRVHEVAATESSDAVFTTAAIEAVKQWTFEPGRKDGKTVATRLTLPMLFTIKDDDRGDWF